MLYIVFWNLYDKVKFVFLNKCFCKVWIDGYIYCLLQNIFEVLCDVDVIFYFFDFQICMLQLYVLGYLFLDIIFWFMLLMFKMDFYEENGLWFVECIRIYVYI